MKIIVKCGSSSIEYEQPEDGTGHTAITYNSGTAGDPKFHRNNELIKAVTAMCHLCAEMEAIKNETVIL